MAQGGAPAAAERVAAPIEHGAKGIDERPRRHGGRGDAHAGLEGAHLRRRSTAVARSASPASAPAVSRSAPRRRPSAASKARAFTCAICSRSKSSALQAAARRRGRGAVERQLHGVERRALLLHRQAVRRPEDGQRRRADVGGELARVGARHGGVDRLVVDQHPGAAVLQPALEEAHHGFVLVRVARDDGDDQIGDREQRLAGDAVVLEDAVEVGRVDQHQHRRQVRLCGDQQLGRVGGRLQRRVGGRVARRTGAAGSAPASARRAARASSVGMRGADQAARRPAGRHRRAERAADQRVEQRRLAGVVGSDDADDQVGVAAGACAAADRARAGRSACAAAGKRSRTGASASRARRRVAERSARHSRRRNHR